MGWDCGAWAARTLTREASSRHEPPVLTGWQGPDAAQCSQQVANGHPRGPAFVTGTREAVRVSGRGEEGRITNLPAT